MSDEEESLQPGRPPLPRRIRLAALLLAVLAVATLIAIRVWPRSTHRSAVPSGTTSVPSAVSPAAPETTKTARVWPTAPSEGCTSPIEVPIVSSRPPAERTGITVLLGGNQLRTVDFDRGRVTAIARARLQAGEFVAGLTASSQTYVITGSCDRPGRFLRIGADGSVSVVRLPGGTNAMLVDDTHVWGFVPAKNPNAGGYLAPLAGGRRVRLPAGFFLTSWVQPHGMILGTLQPDAPPNSPRSLLLVDATTGRVRAHLGTGWPVAASDGLVLWASGCNTVSDKPCMLRSRSVTGGATASYLLPRPAFEGGALSPDGRLIAFVLERLVAPEGRIAGDIAVQHLDTGRLEIVPGIELPTWASPGMAFSADGRWLMIALNAGPTIRLLA